MTGKKRTTVTIYGHQYTIVSDESETHVQEVSQHVHQKMKEMKKVNPFIDTSRLAVLAAVNIADDYLKLKKRTGITNKKKRINRC